MFCEVNELVETKYNDRITISKMAAIMVAKTDFIDTSSV